VKLFVCQSCGNVLYFENRACGRCGRLLAFLPEKVTLSAIEGDDASWKTLADGGEGRAVFGDDSMDYGEALRRHYAEGAPPDWQQRFVSAYATTHPWEDFAETWAHYLHIVDTLEMASEFGMEVRPPADRIGGLSARIAFDPYRTENFDLIVAAWLPFTFAMNSVARAMATRDLYPFILSPEVIRKLSFIHGLVQDIAKRG
jgi:hypothetical protein